MELTPQGYKVKTYDEILKEINDDIQSKIPNFSLDDSNPIIKINKKMSDLFYRMSLMGLNVYSSFNITEASGKALEDRVFWLGITRIKEKKSSGKVEFTGTQNTIIPTGFRVATQDNRIYYTLGDVVIGSNGKAEAFIESLNGGSKTVADVSEVNKIVNPLIGVQSVINHNVVSGGTDTETDTQLRARYYNELLGLGKSTILSVKNTILLNSEATKVNIIENEKDTEQNGLPPHSFKCYVFGGKDDDILDAIYKSRPAGIPSVGEIEKVIDGYYARFSRPQIKNIHFSINLKLNQITSQLAIQDIIKQNILDAVGNVNIGDSLSYTLFISALYKNTGNAITSFDNLQFWFDDSPGTKYGLGDSITPKSNELIAITPSNIVIGAS